jgi:hypothetical protein
MLAATLRGTRPARARTACVCKLVRRLLACHARSSWRNLSCSLAPATRVVDGKVPPWMGRWRRRETTPQRSSGKTRRRRTATARTAFRWMTARTSNSHSTFVLMEVAVTRLDPAVARVSRSTSPCRDAVLGRCARARRKAPALKLFAAATGLRSSTIAGLPCGPSKRTRRASTPRAGVRTARV